MPNRCVVYKCNNASGFEFPSDKEICGPVLLGNFYKFIWEMGGQEYICQVRDLREDKQDVLINFLTKEGDLYTWPAKPDLS